MFYYHVIFNITTTNNISI